MYYSIIGLLAFSLLIITNHDVFFSRNNSQRTSTQKYYYWFLISVLLFYITDIIWGILEQLSMTTLLFIDTEVYFTAMAMGILFWTQYVNAYLGAKNSLRTFLSYAGNLFFISILILCIINIFYPIMFWFDEAGVYHTGIARNITLIVQIIILFITSCSTFYRSSKSKDAERNRYITIGLFGLIVLTFITIQIFEPYLPVYAIGYMLGCSMLHTFVIENENEEYRKDLEIALEREKQELQELNMAWQLAYTDALTGAKSRLAFAEKEDEIDKAISNRTIDKFAVVLFDLNELKTVNDTYGHEAGDEYIIEAYKLIADAFSPNPVYRVGGDEFVVFLENDEYDIRKNYMESFEKKLQENKRDGKAMIAGGYADYIPEQDASSRRVYERADMEMYKRKNEIKQSF